MTGTNFSPLLVDYEKEIFLEDVKSHLRLRRRISTTNLTK